MTRKHSIGLLLLVLFTLGHTRVGFNENILEIEILPSKDKIVQGEPFQLAIVLKIQPTLHINSNAPLSEFFIPTELTFEPQTNISFGAPIFPPPKLKTFPFSEDKVSIYEGTVAVVVPVSTSPDLQLGPLPLKGEVSYQGCDDNVCFAPEEQSFQISLEVVAAGTPVEEINQQYFELSVAEPEMELTRDEAAALEYLERGMFGAILAFFVVGLALNLTPCVYPIIPLTVSYFGGQSEKTKGSAFGHALLYLFGIALAFALLGLVSGLAGKQWGFLFQSPWFVVVIATIILLMAAGLFGAFEITVPSWLLTRAGRSKEGGVGAFLMGVTAGVVIAPCAAGIIIGLVGLVAKLGLILEGTILFFVMGLGLGLPYLVLATFSGLLGKLPQSGGWMLWIKKVFGFMLIGVALYFILPQLEQIVGKLGFMIGLVAVTAGILLGFLEHGTYSKSFSRVRKIIGVILIALGIFWTYTGINAKKSEINWVTYTNQSVEQLLQEEKPVFIDFYADWCAPCKQLDRVTFTDKNVTKLSDQFIMLKVDCTKPDTHTSAFMKQFDVTGMPTLVFISNSGTVLEELREVGFIPPEDFLVSMQTALESE